jgi:Leucine-rich repeat (LRR) protein
VKTHSIQIAAISGLSQLVQLKRLDLSFNKIRKIENLAELLSLEYLDLRGNSISSVNDLDELRMVSRRVCAAAIIAFVGLTFVLVIMFCSQLPTLQTLHLQDSDGDNGNPC